MKCKLYQIGTTHYQEVDKLQKEILNKISKDGHPNTLILFESKPIITLGRNSQKEDLDETLIQKEAIELVQVDRGGKATYHGPGQLICFGVFNLAYFKKDIKFYLDRLEEVAINFLKNYNTEGKKSQNHRGVWVGEKKIASIGIGIKRWISFHGMSLNVNVDLTRFYLINPCGLIPDKMTSLSRILKNSVSMKEAFKFTAEAFKEVFELNY